MERARKGKRYGKLNRQSKKGSRKVKTVENQVMGKGRKLLPPSHYDSKEAAQARKEEASSTGPQKGKELALFLLCALLIIKY